MASSTSRIEVERGRPPGYTGIKGSTRAHCSSVRSLGYRCVRIPTTYEKHPSRTASEMNRLRDVMRGKGGSNIIKHEAALNGRPVPVSDPYPEDAKTVQDALLSMRDRNWSLQDA